jgi:general secretion pathway protein A
MLGIESGKGFIVIAGRVGTGKTTILRAVLRRLGRELDVAVLNQPDLDPAELLRTILGEFGVGASGEDKVALRKTLREFLQRRPSPAILAIDEAHLLSEESLEQVRLLSNFEEADRKLLQIVLAGQPELKDLLSRARLRPLAQRIEMFYEIEPLSPEETSAYILRRIQIAGQPDDLEFEPQALDEIHARTGGVPRLINVLAERALITAYVGETKTITRAVVREAFQDLGEVTQRVMGDPGPEIAASPRAASPRAASPGAADPIRFARSSGRTWTPAPAQDAGRRRHLGRWLAGIGLGVVALLAVVVVGSRRAMSSRPGAPARSEAVSPSGGTHESTSPQGVALQPPADASKPAPAVAESLAMTPPAASTPAPSIPPREEPKLAVPIPWTEPESAESEKVAVDAEKNAFRAPAPPVETTAGRTTEPEPEPAPPVTLSRDIETPELRPEDVPLVDEASGSEGTARYTIQCGSFRDRDRALELVARIGASTAERMQILPMEMSSGTWYRVLLGDFESEAQARAKIAQVHAHDRLLVLQVVRLSRPSPMSAG